MEGSNSYDQGKAHNVNDPKTLSGTAYMSIPESSAAASHRQKSRLSIGTPHDDASLFECIIFYLVLVFGQPVFMAVGYWAVSSVFCEPWIGRLFFWVNLALLHYRGPEVLGIIHRAVLALLSPWRSESGISLLAESVITLERTISGLYGVFEKVSNTFAAGVVDHINAGVESIAVQLEALHHMLIGTREMVRELPKDIVNSVAQVVVAKFESDVVPLLAENMADALCEAFVFKIRDANEATVRKVGDFLTPIIQRRVSLANRRAQVSLDNGTSQQDGMDHDLLEEIIRRLEQLEELQRNTENTVAELGNRVVDVCQYLDIIREVLMARSRPGASNDTPPHSETANSDRIPSTDNEAVTLPSMTSALDSDSDDDSDTGTVLTTGPSDRGRHEMETIPE